MGIENAFLNTRFDEVTEELKDKPDHVPKTKGGRGVKK